MYSTIYSSVRVNNSLTDEFKVEIGTRQGCNLSPTLFNLYLNDLPIYLSQHSKSGVSLGSTNIQCLMYADDLVLLAKTEKEMNEMLSATETYCNKWRLSINTNKSKILILNKRSQNNHSFKLYDSKLEEVQSYNYLGIIISKRGDFKIAINHLHDKAARAFYSIRKHFNFYNNTNPKTLLRLFDSIIKPILLYGSEIWALYGWSKNTIKDINNFLLCTNTKFETLHSKACKNALGVHRKATEVLAKAELGRFPLMLNIIQYIYNYWQHVLSSNPRDLIHIALKHNIEQDRIGKMNYYTRIKGLLIALNSPLMIYKENNPKVATNTNLLKCKFKTLYINHFFNLTNIKANRPSGGRFEIYNTIKQNYNCEDYIHNIRDNTLRRHITNIRISTHNLPVEKLRKANIPKHLRFCKLCDQNTLGDEFHTVMLCPNTNIASQRKTLHDNISLINTQWNTLTNKQQFTYLLLAHDKLVTPYFAIFLDKVNKMISGH